MAVAVPTAPSTIADESFSFGGFSARKALALGATLVLLVVSVVLLAPAFADLPGVWERLGDGDVKWLAAAFVFELLSFAGHIVLFSAVAQNRGAGGIALTAWAMRRSGMERVEVASRMITFHVLLYGVYAVHAVHAVHAWARWWSAASWAAWTAAWSPR